MDREKERAYKILHKQANKENKQVGKTSLYICL